MDSPRCARDFGDHVKDLVRESADVENVLASTGSKGRKLQLCV